MSEEKRLIPQEQEKPFDSGDVDIVSGVIDEFVAEQELVADLPPEQRAEVSRATLGKSITKGSFTRNLPEGAKSAQLSEKDANLLVREVAFSEAGAYEELLNLLSQGQVNSENVEAEARKAMAKSQGNIRGFFEKARLFIFGSQREEEDLKSREAFSFVTAELVRIMGEIFQSMDFADEDENTLWKRFRISLSTTTLLPLTLLQVVRNSMDFTLPTPVYIDRRTLPSKQRRHLSVRLVWLLAVNGKMEILR